MPVTNKSTFALGVGGGYAGLIEKISTDAPVTKRDFWRAAVRGTRTDWLGFPRREIKAARSRFNQGTRGFDEGSRRGVRELDGESGAREAVG